MAGKTGNQLASDIAEPGQDLLPWIVRRLNAIERWMSAPRDALDLNENIYTCKATRNAAQTMVSGGDFVDFPDISWDPTDMRQAGNETFAIQLDGRYRCSAFIRWETIQVGFKYQVALWKNGSEFSGQTGYGDATSGGERNNCSMEEAFTEGDIIQVRAFTDHTVSKQILQAAVAISYIGPLL